MRNALTRQSPGPEKAPFHSAFSGRLLRRYVTTTNRVVKKYDI